MGGCKRTILGGNIGGKEGTLVGTGIQQFWEETLVGGGSNNFGKEHRREDVSIEFWEGTLVGGREHWWEWNQTILEGNIGGRWNHTILGRNIGGRWSQTILGGNIGGRM